MGEAVRLEWLEGINGQHTVVVFPESVAPKLIKKPSERTNALIYTALRHLLTLVSFLKALMMGSVYFNIGRALK